MIDEGVNQNSKGKQSHGSVKRALCRAQLGQAPEQAAVDPVAWQQFMEKPGR